MSTRRVDKTDSSVSFAPLKLENPPGASLGGLAEGAPERHSTSTVDVECDSILQAPTNGWWNKRGKLCCAQCAEHRPAPAAPHAIQKQFDTHAHVCHRMVGFAYQLAFCHALGGAPDDGVADNAFI